VFDGAASTRATSDHDSAFLQTIERDLDTGVRNGTHKMTLSLPRGADDEIQEPESANAIKVI
jgi:hypothetical protein